MKKVVFSAILLIILGTAWTLYLEHENKRFARNFLPRPSTVMEPVNTTETSVASGNGANSNPLEKPVIKDAHLHPHPHIDTLGQTEESGTVLEELPVDTVAPNSVLSEEEKETSDASPERKRSLLNPFNFDDIPIDQETARKARETVRRIQNNPKYWISGSPGEDGFSFVLGPIESEELAEAHYILAPTESNRKELERARQRAGRARQKGQINEVDAVAEFAEALRRGDIQFVDER